MRFRSSCLKLSLDISCVFIREVENWRLRSNYFSSITKLTCDVKAIVATFGQWPSFELVVKASLGRGEEVSGKRKEAATK